MGTYLSDVRAFATHIRASDDLELALAYKDVRGDIYERQRNAPRVISTSFGMKLISSCTSRQGWRESFNTKFPVPFSVMTGLTYRSGAFAETWAKLIEMTIDDEAVINDLT